MLQGLRVVSVPWDIFRYPVVVPVYALVINFETEICRPVRNRISGTSSGEETLSGVETLRRGFETTKTVGATDRKSTTPEAGPDIKR